MKYLNFIAAFFYFISFQAFAGDISASAPNIIPIDGTPMISIDNISDCSQTDTAAAAVAWSNGKSGPWPGGNQDEVMSFGSGQRVDRARPEVIGTSLYLKNRDTGVKVLLATFPASQKCTDWQPQQIDSGTKLVISDLGTVTKYYSGGRWGSGDECDLLVRLTDVGECLPQQVQKLRATFTDKTGAQVSFDFLDEAYL